VNYILKLSLSNVLSESISFYKKNIVYLLGFSIIYVMNDLMWASFDIVLFVHAGMEESMERLAFTMRIFPLFFMWVAALFVFGPRFILAIILFINHLMEGKKITLIQAYKRTKGKYWLVLGFFVLMVCVRDAPRIIFSYSPHFHSELIHSLYASGIRALFYLLFPIVALTEKSNDYLKRALQMTKGNYLKILLLCALTITLTPYVFYIIERRIDGFPLMFTVMNLYAIVLLFVFPFAQTVNLVVYRKLTKETNDIENKMEIDEVYIKDEGIGKLNNLRSRLIILIVVLSWPIVSFLLNVLINFYVAFLISWIILAYGIFLISSEERIIRTRGVLILAIWGIFFIIGILRIILSL